MNRTEPKPHEHATIERLACKAHKVVFEGIYIQLSNRPSSRICRLAIYLEIQTTSLFTIHLPKNIFLADMNAFEGVR